MENPPYNMQGQPSYYPQAQQPEWEGDSAFSPPQHQQQFPPHQQGYLAQYPSQGNVQLPPVQQSQYAPYSQPQWQQLPQQPPAHLPQWEKMQPPEGTWQPAPLQSNPSQYPPQQWQHQPLQHNLGQQMYVPQMYPPVMPMMPQPVVNVNIQQHQHGLFTRALYFIFIGWWAGLIWLNIGYFFVMTIVGLPLGLMMLNRLPTVLTLKSASQSVNITVTGSTTNINIVGVQQVNFLIRALYFVFIGWWAGFFWAWLAYAMFALIVTIPVGFIMLNMLPAIITLRKN